MKNIILAEPSTMALLALGFFMLVIAVVVVLTVILVFFLTRRAKKTEPQASQPPSPLHTTIKICPKCRAPMPPDSPEGLCPRCLIAMNLATQTDIPGEPGAAKAPPPPPAAVADVAKLFPQLEILECLGRGGMGAVYKARQPRLDRIVALKILSPEKQGNQKFGERFEREARALAKLHHPNIVTVFDFGEVQGNFYLLMEFVDGLTLRQLLQSRKLSPPEALAIVPKICEALQYAHEQGIVHRDIKPENILMDKDGRIKIADFGIAKILGDGGSSNLTAEQVIGTPHYMSPEQIEKPQSVDHRADIYSLGVVFYEMLTGELPLGKFQPPSKKVHIDVRLDEIVLRALEKEPERRYQQASEVKTQVETVVATPDTGRSRREEAQIKNQSRPAPVATAFRRGAWVALSIFLLITLAAAGVTALMQRTYLATAEVLLAPNSAPQHPLHSSSGAAIPDFSPQLPENFRVPNELQIIQSPKVLEPVALSLNLPARWGAKLGHPLDIDQTVDLIRMRLNLEAARNTTAVLNINFYSESPWEAAEIANKIAETYCALPSDLQKEIISRAMQPSHPVRPNAGLNLFLGAVAGMVLGIVAGMVVGLISFFSVRKKVKLQFQLQVQKPDHFWRWFAVTVLALISIPFLISILGLLAAIAIPNFVKARARAQAIRQQSLAMQHLPPKSTPATSTDASTGNHPNKEDTYTITSVLQILNPVNPVDMNDDFQDVRVLSQDKDSCTVEVTYYPLNQPTIGEDPDWRKDDAGMTEYLRPSPAENWDEKMQGDLVAELRLAGIDPDKLTDKQLVEQVSHWAMRRAHSTDAFSIWAVYFLNGQPAVYPPLREAFDRQKPDKTWTDGQMFDQEVLGKSMFYNKVHGSCTSSSVYLATIFRALGIPTRIIFCVPPFDPNDDMQARMFYDNVHYNRAREIVRSALDGVRGFDNHVFNEVYVGHRWVRLNYDKLGQPILDAHYFGLLTHIYTCSDLSEVPLAQTWGMRYFESPDKAGQPDLSSQNPYCLLSVQDHFGANAHVDNPEMPELKTVSIIGLYPPGSPEIPAWVGDFSNENADFLIAIKEWIPGIENQLRTFQRHCPRDFLLTAQQQQKIRVHLTSTDLTAGDGSFQAFGAQIDEGDRNKLIPGIAYSIQPINTSDTYRWTVAPDVTIIPAISPATGLPQNSR